MPEESTTCGLGSWRPSWLQRLANKQAYVVVYSVLGAVQGMGHTYLSSVLSSMEKQFGIKSEEAAWIFSGNEISQIFFIFFFPFLARIKRRSLWTSVATLGSAFGIFLCALPYLVSDKAQYKGLWKGGEGVKGAGKGLCGEEGEEQCQGQARDWAGITLIFVGYFITGIGTSFFYSFGIPYIDDNVSKKNSPLALSVIMAGRTLGPTLGFILGSFCLRIYVSPGQESPGLQEGDPGFLGAWWLGFLVISACTAVVAPLLALFPQALPTTEDTDQRRMDREKTSDSEPQSGRQFLRETLECSRRLARNKVWVFGSLSTIFLLFGFIGFGTFVPKYFEYHFRRSASSSGNSGGLSKAAGTVVGILLSGAVITKFKPSARTLSAYNVLVGLVTTCMFLAGAFMACDRLEVTQPPASCLADCACSLTSFQPTCSSSGLSLYFSPCHAGCSDSSTELGSSARPRSLYSSCSCLPPSNSSLAPWWQEEQELPSPAAPAPGSLPEAISGYCPAADCSSAFTMLLGILVVGSLVGATGRLGNQLVGLRAVEPRDKAASMLVMVAVLSLLVFLPSPLVFGRLMDNACLVWGNKCGNRTHCVLYDTDLMRTSMFFLVSGFMLLGTLFDVGVWVYCGHVEIFDPEAKEAEEVKEVEQEMGKVVKE